MDKKAKAGHKPSCIRAQEGLWSLLDLARSYCPVGQPPEYRRRSRVSHLSSGWNQCGATTPCAPGKLLGEIHPEDCTKTRIKLW